MQTIEELIEVIYEGEVITEFVDAEPWTFYTHSTKRVVEGTLEAQVLARTGLTGKVESVERNYSSGTCELCGYGEDGITILVDNKIVFSYAADNGEYSYEAPDEPSPYLVLMAWLNGGDDGAGDLTEYEEPTEKEY